MQIKCQFVTISFHINIITENQKEDQQNLQQQSNEEQKQEQTIQSQDQQEKVEQQENTQSCFQKYKIRQQQASYWQLFFMQALNTIIMTAEKQGSTMALPYIQSDFNISQTLAQWVTTINTIVNTSVTVPLSLLSQKFGINVMIEIYYLVQIGGCIGLFFSTNFYLFLLFRLLVGVSAVQSAANTKMITRLMSSKQNQQKFMQYNKITSMSLGLVLPTIMGFIIDYNWRYVYILAGCLCFCNMIYILFFEKIKKNKKVQKVNPYGTVLMFLTLLSLALLMQFLSDKNWLASGIAGGCFVLFGIFTLIINIKSQVKILPTKVLQHPTKDYIIVASLNTMSMCLMSYLLPQTYYAYGYDSVTYSIVLFAKNVCNLITSFIMPKLSQKILNKTIISISIICSIVLSLFYPASCLNIIALSVNYVLYDAATQFNVQLVVPCVTLSVPYSQTILITGVPQTIYNIVQSLTLPVMVSIFQLSYQGFLNYDNSQISWEHSLQIQLVLIPIICITELILIQKYTGQLDVEKDKKKFDESKVKMLQVEDDEEELLTKEKQ